LADKSQRERLQLAETLFQEKKYVDAFPLVERLYLERPSSFQTKLLFGRVLKELNRRVEAEKILHELDIQYPNNLNVLIELATYHHRLGNVEESIEYFNKVLFLDPYNTLAKDRLQKIQEIKKNQVAEKLEDTLTEFWDVSHASRDELKKEAVFPEVHVPAGIEADDIQVRDDIGEIQEQPLADEPMPHSLSVDSSFEKQAQDEFSSLFATADPPLEEAQGNPDKTEYGTRPGMQPEPMVDDSIPADFGGLFDMSDEEEPAEPTTDDLTQVKTVADLDAEDDLPMVQATVPAKKKLGDTADIEFETESAADLYFRQGLYREAQKIYKKLYLHTSDEKYFAKLNEIANIQSRTKEYEVIDRLTKLMNLLQEKGRNHVV
jgi:tetratricopeptide (TPR) repeat protein